MRLLIATDEHYISDGLRIHSEQGTSPYRVWYEYLQIFEQIALFARVRYDRSFLGKAEAVVSGPGVEVIEIPFFRGPFQYLRMRSQLSQLAHQVIPQADAFLLRVPGLIGGSLAKALRRTGRGYAVQVVGDPWDVYGAGQTGGTLRPLYRQVLTYDLKRVCKTADALWYVTQRSLQQRYPPPEAAFVVACTDSQIGDALATPAELRIRLDSITTPGKRRPNILGWVGSFWQRNKRADILLKAGAICRTRGLDLQIRFAGDGKLLHEYEQLAAQLGIADRVEFLGHLGAGKPIYEFLDSIDLFVMSSPAEGLPRAMLEAMARACPCIGTYAGGMPELLDESALVQPGDPTALADRIMEKLAEPEELARMALRNHKEARKYTPERVSETRLSFLMAIRDRARRHESIARKIEPGAKR